MRTIGLLQWLGSSRPSLPLLPLYYSFLNNNVIGVCLSSGPIIDGVRNDVLLDVGVVTYRQWLVDDVLMAGW